MGVEGFNRILEELRKDYVHGASWYYEQAARAVLELGGLDEDRLNELLEVRPGMASVINVVAAYKRGLASGLTLDEIYRRLMSYKSTAFERLKEARLELTSAITISSSSAVAALFSSVRPLKVYLLESRPGDEHREALKAFKEAGVPEVVVIPDSSMALFMEYVDAVVVGADGVYSSGHLVNKVGTMPLACVGRAMGKRVIAVAESYKFVDGFPPPSHVVVEYGGAKVPIFERVDLSLFTEIITDLGAIESPSAGSVKEVSEAFIRSIVGGP